MSAADAKFAGEAEGSAAGFSLSAAGDVDADGYGDILVGASGKDGDRPENGSAYLILGIGL